jgi:hypothetical protein
VKRVASADDGSERQVRKSFTISAAFEGSERCEFWPEFEACLIKSMRYTTMTRAAKAGRNQTFEF